MKKRKIIVFRAGIDSLDCFAENMAEGFEKKEYPVLMADMQDVNITRKKIRQFADADAAVCAIFFNHVGEALMNEAGTEILWNELDADCYDYIVDHPMYYHEAIIFPIKKLTFLCVDEYHAAFIKRFYKDRVRAYFVPLAGVRCETKDIPFEERSMDILFTGAYMIDDNIEIHTAGLGSGVAALWRECYVSLLRDKSMTLERAIEQCLVEKGIEMSDEDLLDTIRLFRDMDGVVRSRMRENVVRALADADIKVHVYGEGWQYLDCKQENLIVHPRVSFKESIRLAADAKIVLNIMPWFKSGVHDRIYTAMLNQSIALTDTSEYIDRTLTDRENVVLYSLEQLEQLPDKVRNLLADPSKIKAIAEKGYAFANEKQEWKQRAEAIAQLFR